MVTDISFNEYITKKLDELSDRIARIEAEIDNIKASIEDLKKYNSCITELKADIASLKTEVANLKVLATKRNGLLKLVLGTMVTVIVVFLSFIATIMGKVWVPP